MFRHISGGFDFPNLAKYLWDYVATSRRTSFSSVKLDPRLLEVDRPKNADFQQLICHKSARFGQ